MTPTATVLLPVYNAESYLVESLESLLRQTYTDFEILAIDDASRDRSPAILREYAERDRRIRVLTQPKNQGLVEALNLGLRAASSRYIVRHDADDRAHPDRIQKSLEFLARNPDVVLLGTWMTRMDTAGNAVGLQRFPTSDSEIRWQLLFRNPFAHSTVVFDRVKAMAVGGYSPAATHAEDYDLWIRLAALGKFAILPESLCDYRVHAESVSLQHTEAMEAHSARLGARWLGVLCGSVSPSEKYRLHIETWEQFRKRMPLAPKELDTLFSFLLTLVKTHPVLHGVSEKHAAADLAWHFVSYLKRQPKLAQNPRLLFSLFRHLPALSAWPAARWRTA